MKVGEVIIEEALPADYIDANTKEIKYAVKVKTNGVWGHMARRTPKGKDKGVIFFKTGVERDRYMFLLVAQFGPRGNRAGYQPKLKTKGRIKPKFLGARK